MPHPNPTTGWAMITSLCHIGQSAKADQIFDAAKAYQNSYWLRAMIADYVLHGRDREGLRLFKWFQTMNLNPDEFMLSNILSMSASLNALKEGRQVHAFIVKKNVAMDVAVSNSLINLYIKCDSMNDAETVFDTMPVRDVFTWTGMVSGYALNGRLEKAMDFFNKMPTRNTVSWNSMINAYQREGCNDMALELFSRMKAQGEAPNDLTYVAVMKACSTLKQLEEIHCCLVKLGWIRNVRVGCTVLDMYVKCGGLQDIQRAFHDIGEHNVVSWSILLGGYAQNGKILEAEEIFKRMIGKNVIAWNVMITGYVENGMQDKAFSLFVEMKNDGMKPNSFTFTSLISGCSNPQFVRSGKKFHGYVVKEGLESNTSVCNSLITMYAEQKNVGDARLIFNLMFGYDVVSWTAMVAAYILDGNIDEAHAIFDRMPMKSLISWNTMMFGYMQHSRSTEAYSLDRMRHSKALMFFYNMEKSVVKPDHFSYNCVLSVCASIGALVQARAIHCRIVRRGYESDLGVGNALITVYGKCGALSEAELCFKTITFPDKVSWNALLTGYSQNGQGDKVLNFYEQMQRSKVAPNHVTFISLLSACSHLGEVKKGMEFFQQMEKDHGISPTREHYTCMVDLLGRAGYLDEAESIIAKMPIKPDSVVWGALLGACKMYGDPAIGKRAADQILLLEPDNSSALVSLAETFAGARMWKAVAQVRALMKEKKLLKEPGLSLIEIRDQTHTFLSGDCCIQEKDLIHEMLHSLYGNMIEESCATGSGLLAFG
ncbi:hypothetical protein Cni_G28796 [Canna indica]|uniref:Pentatricopeptide repeat-containing protein n=1 Tax=Canna indica TaxID=4628 RepID=A0AAQ3QQL1_9LILI|nr:hypothetical protein Cni_G28796 [Canna indica]